MPDISSRRPHRIPFAEASDSDSSLATNTTAESEQREIYNVEHICAETDTHPRYQGRTAYLLKWEGYPEYRATWEPRENIQNDILLHQWERRKARVRAGREEAFDVDAFELDLERREEERIERRRRRKEKRRRRGVSVSSSSHEEFKDEEGEGGAGVVVRSPKRRRLPLLDSEDEELVEQAATPAVKRKKVKAPVVKRRGVATKVSSSRRAELELSQDEGDVDEDDVGDSDMNSLFEQGSSQPIYPDLDKTVPTSASKAVAAPAGTKELLPPKKRPPTTAAAPSSTKPVPKSTPAPTPTAASASRKSAPLIVPSTTKLTQSNQTAKRTNSIFANFSDPSRKRRERARVSGETPKDNSAGAKFANLAQQNRFQKYSRNERAPDIEKLVIVDPKTGRAEAPRVPPPIQTAVPAATTVSRGPDEIHSVYGRRTSPKERRRSLTPPTLSAVPEPRRENSNTTFVAGPGFRRTETCWDWINNSCKFSADTCRRAHWDIDPTESLPQFGAEPQDVPPPPPPPLGRKPTKKETTCAFWRRGGCKFASEADCEFAHWDTGIYSNLQGDLTAKHAELGSRKLKTCWFWGHWRNCKRSDAECPYAHWETGVSAGPPPGFRMPAGGVPPALTGVGADGKRGDGRSPSAAGFGMSPVGEVGVAQSPDGVQLNLMAPFRTPVAQVEQARAFPFPVADSVAAQRVGEQAVARVVPQRSVGFRLPVDEAPAVPQQQLQQRQDTTAGVHQAVLQVQTASGGPGAKIYANLHITALRMFEQLFYPVSKGVYLMPDRMVTASDIQTWLADTMAESTQWPGGSVVAMDASFHVADKLAECGRLNVAGFVSVQDAFTLVLYPARSNADEWRFLDIANVPAVPNALLKFRLLAPLRGLDRRGIKTAAAADEFDTAPTTPSLELRASAVAIDALLGFDAETLLREKESKPRNTGVFFAWPADHDAELQLLVKYFQDNKCKVYHSGTKGAWACYRGKYTASGVVVVHPDTPLWQIPRLYSVLTGRGGATRVFCIGVQQVEEYNPLLDEQPPPTFSCKRLFPHGAVTFLTDDVFVHHPERASEIIQLFLEDTKRKGEAGQNDKIATRPGVKDWLAQLALERTSDRGRQDLRYLQLYHDICLLCPPEAESSSSSFSPPTPLPSSHLLSFSAADLPSFQGLWAKDEVAATDMMVEWFAGWSVFNADKYRRFLVCYEPSRQREEVVVVDADGKTAVRNVNEADPRGWGRKWAHLGVQGLEEVVRAVREKARGRK